MILLPGEGNNHFIFCTLGIVVQRTIQACKVCTASFCTLRMQWTFTRSRRWWPAVHSLSAWMRRRPCCHTDSLMRNFPSWNRQKAAPFNQREFAPRNAYRMLAVAWTWPPFSIESLGPRLRYGPPFQFWVFGQKVQSDRGLFGERPFVEAPKKAELATKEVRQVA